MDQLMFIPSWGVWIGVLFLVTFASSVLLLKKEAKVLENRADEIEEVQEARRKSRG